MTTFDLEVMDKDLPLWLKITNPYRHSSPERGDMMENQEVKTGTYHKKTDRLVHLYLGTNYTNRNSKTDYNGKKTREKGILYIG